MGFMALLTVSWLSLAGQANGPCAKPDALLAVSMTEESVQLTWSADGGDLNFEVEIRSRGRAPSFRNTYRTDVATLSVGGLAPGSTYRFRVKTLCAVGSSSGSTAWMEFTTEGMAKRQACPKATDLAAEVETAESALLSWQPGAFQGHVEVEVRSKGKTPWYHFEVSTPGSHLLIHGLSPKGSYKFRVRSNCTGGAVSGATRWFHFQTGDEPKPEPCSGNPFLVAKHVDTTGLSISWQDKKNLDYTLQLTDSQLFDTIIVQAASPVQLSGLVIGQKYQVKLTIACHDGITVHYDTSITLTEPTDEDETCEVPADLSAVADSTGYLLKWVGGKNAIGFQLQLETRDTAPLILVDTQLLEAIMQFERLDSVEQYRYRVRALCAMDAVSAYSQWFNLPAGPVASGGAACQPADILSALTLPDSSVWLAWHAAKADSFEVSVWLTGTDLSSGTTLSGGQSFLRLSDLTVGAEYMYQVTTYCGGESYASKVFDFSIVLDSTLCIPPLVIESASAFTNGFTLGWGPHFGQQYLVEVRAVDSTLVSAIKSSEPSLSFVGLDPGTMYQISIVAQCDNLVSSALTATYLTAALECPMPAGFEVFKTGKNFGHMRWVAAGAKSYTVEVKGIGHSFTNFETTTSTILKFTGLRRGLRYVARVRSDCGEDGVSNWSEPVEFTAIEGDEVDCTPIDSLWSEVTPDGVYLHWSNHAKGRSYHVEIENVGHTVALSMTRFASGPGLKVYGLPPGGHYQWKVYLFCGEADYDSTSDWQYLELPEDDMSSCLTPTDLAATYENGAFRLVWSEVPGAVDYEVELEGLGSVGWYQSTEITFDPTYLANSLEAGASYQFKVNAWCGAAGQSTDSPWHDFEATERMDTLAAGVRVFPNPTTSWLEVSLPQHQETGQVTLELSDLSGRIATTQRFQRVSGGDRIRFHLGSLRDGMYRLRVLTPGSADEQLIVVTH